MKLYICGGSFTVKDKSQVCQHWAEYLAEYLKLEPIWLGKVAASNDLIHSQVEYAVQKILPGDLIIVWLESLARMSYCNDSLTDDAIVNQINYSEYSSQVEPSIDYVPRINSNVVAGLPEDLKHVFLKYFDLRLLAYKDKQVLQSMLWLSRQVQSQIFFINYNFGYDAGKEVPTTYGIDDKHWINLNREFLLNSNDKHRHSEPVNHLSSHGHIWVAHNLISHFKNQIDN